MSGYSLMPLLYAPLVYQDDDQELIAGIASEFEIAPDRGEFVISDAATCSDGTPLTASAAAASIENYVANSIEKYFTFGPGTVSVAADDGAKTLTIELSEPWADMAQAITKVGIVCPAGLADAEALGAGAAAGAFSGPYVIDSYNPGVELTLELREDYVFPEYATPLEGAAPANIRFAINGDPNSITNNLLTGAYDTAGLNAQSIERFEGNDDFESQRFAVAVSYIVFNQRPGSVFADEKNRQAVAQSISWEAFDQATNGGAGDRLTSFAASDVQCVNTDESLLLESGDAAASKPLEGLTIRFVGTQLTGPNGAGNSYISQALTEAGAEVTLENLDNNAWIETLTTKPDAWDMTVMGSTNPTRTLANPLSQLVGPTQAEDGRNIIGVRNPEVEAQLQALMSEEDGEKRCDTWQDIQTELITTATVVPLSASPSYQTTRTGFAVRGIGGVVRLDTLRITE
ncbi:ABC transporter substrate-binding protein [Leucobacter triazinivorans]|uniref:ABC transporter substrate-binding protein n=1 Tax=Leucobacter triazinivorans TaxID=1784719 RepID=UPI0013EE9C7E|nr:ABC transporter substrate-binding protein [Leucobacter triazinivorans]